MQLYLRLENQEAEGSCIPVLMIFQCPVVRSPHSCDVVRNKLLMRDADYADLLRDARSFLLGNEQRTQPANSKLRLRLEGNSQALGLAGTRCGKLWLLELELELCVPVPPRTSARPARRSTATRQGLSIRTAGRKCAKSKYCTRCYHILPETSCSGHLWTDQAP